jgi:hypothetical protein
MSNPHLPPPDWTAKPKIEFVKNGDTLTKMEVKIPLEKVGDKASRIARRLRQFLALVRKSG